jgi:(p)ppGpp synthase/HD superfamily hydrolase
MEPLIIRACKFAKEAHKDQKRKYTNEPYINHCHNVATIVTELPESTHEMVAAAYLHDTIEDCGVTFDTLKAEFGELTALYVRSLTDVYTKESFPNLNRATRKRLEAERFHFEPAQVKTIKLADLIDNTSSIVEHDANFATVYLKEKKAMLQYLEGGNAELYERAKNHIVK